MIQSTLRRWQSEVGDAHVVSLVRLILGVLLFVSACREANELQREGFFGDVFHLAILPEALVPTRPVFVVLVGLELGLAGLVILGRFARPALLFSALIGMFVLLCDRVRYHNNRYALLLFAFILAFAPCDRAFVFSRGPTSHDDRLAPLWAQRLAQLQLAIIYLASGGSKLIDADWRAGRVIGDRLVRSTAMAVAKGVPITFMGWLSDPAVSSTLAKLAIFTELFLAFALFVPRARFFALWWGVMFHLTIEVTSQVELFTWLTLTIYALFARPTLGERIIAYDAGRPGARRLARLVGWLDWLRRFRMRAEPSQSDGPMLVVIDRDGSEATGLWAFFRIARATPVLFPLSVPLLVTATCLSPKRR
jgi:hypothetical protein